MKNTKNKTTKIKNLKSKTLLASATTLLTLLSFLLINYSPIFCMAVVAINIAIIFIFYFLHKDAINKNKNDTLKLLMLFNILFLGYAYYLVDKNNTIDQESQVMAINIKQPKPLYKNTTSLLKVMTVGEMLSELKSKVSDNISRQDLEVYMKTLEKEVASRVVSTSSASYRDMGMIYEAAYVLNVTRDKDLALSNYVQALNISNKNGEDYAAVARLLALDKKDKAEAVKFAKKAIGVSKNKNEKESYQKLLDYIISL